MLAAVSRSPMRDTKSWIFKTDPADQTELTNDYLQDLIHHYPVAECSMCGDVGLQEKLFRCIKCQVRNQHTYCSRYYPNRRSYSGVCDWCHTGEDSNSFAQDNVARAVSESECTKIYPWRNDLEMLLAAAEVSRQPSLEDEAVPRSVLSDSCVVRRGSWSGFKRPRKSMRTKAALCSTSNFKCKQSKLEPSSLFKRIGRRYKYVLDVY